MEGDDRTMWVLQISVNPGAPLGGSVSQYFVGNFNGTHFTPVDGVTRLTDFSKDNYAGQFFYGIPATEKQISFGWASNWQYTDLVPTGNTEGWRSQMSVPRYQYLANVTAIGYNMFSAPYNIQSIFSQELAYNKSFGNGTILIDYSTVASGALYVEANVTGLTASTLQGMINMTFISSVSGEFVAVGSPLDSGKQQNTHYLAELMKGLKYLRQIPGSTAATLTPSRILTSRTSFPRLPSIPVTVHGRLRQLLIIPSLKSS